MSSYSSRVPEKIALTLGVHTAATEHINNMAKYFLLTTFLYLSWFIYHFSKLF